MADRPIIRILAVAWALFASPPALAEDISVDRMVGELDAVLDDSIQQELPGDPTPPKMFSLPDWLVSLLGSTSRLAILVGAVVVLALLIAWAAQRWSRSREPDEAATLADAPVRMDVKMSEVETLAQAGRFGEAMHLLLQLALSRLSLTRESELSDALTSREVLRGSNLGTGSRETLRDLVLAVERTHFGGTPAGASDYEDCRRWTQDFLETLKGTP